MKELGILSIDNLYRYHTAIQVYKCLSGMSPNYLCSMFQICGENHNYGLRNVGTDVRPPLPHLEITKRSFRYSGAYVWNTIPVEIRQCTSIGTFKLHLKQHLFNL